MDIRIMCRTCLRSGVQMESIFDTSLKISGSAQMESVVELLKSFANIEITRNDDDPDQICASCLQEIRRIFSFKLKCEKSQDVLKNLKSKRNSINQQLKRQPKTEKFYTVDENGVRDCFQIEYLDNSEDEENAFQDNIKEDSQLSLCLERDEIDTGDFSNIADVVMNNQTNSNELCETDQSTSQHATTDRNIPRETYLKRYQPVQSSFVCKFCKENLGSRDALMGHMEAKHMIVKLPGDFSCAICLKSCKSRLHLYEHMIIHTDYRPYKCDICSITFKYKSNWNSHMKYVENTNRSSWKCLICSRNFRRRYNLTLHMRRHNSKFITNCHNKKKNK